MMSKRMEMKMPRRVLSLALSAAMVLSLLPAFAFAEGNDGLCEHHTEHTAECGYVAAVEGQECGHVHDGNCGYAEASDCTHSHDESCGYVAAVAGHPCGFVCQACAEAESKPTEPQPEAACSLTQGCTLPNGHDGPCIAAPAHGCDGTLVPVEGDEGEQLWGCPVCGALLDAQGNELPAVSTYTSGTFNGSPAEVDADGNLLINATNFPDGNFREFVRQYDKDSSDSLSTAEVAAVDEMRPYSREIGSLKGIEYFTALTWLDCNSNQLTSLDVSQNTALTNLYCDGNRLTSLDVSGNRDLTSLKCGSNRLTSLDVGENEKLTYLGCQCNNITSLDVSGNRDLTSLECGFNRLTSLDVGKNEKLTVLGCPNNKITSLDVSSLPDLVNLYCRNNALTSLDLSSNTSLRYIEISKQEATGEYIQKGSAYLFDLGKLVGADNLSKVSNVTGGSYDSATGMVTLDTPVNGEATVKYNYDATQGSMDVTMTLTAHNTHSFDENGDCACGLVKRVPYVDAQGNSLGTQDCAVITKDTKTLIPGGWYVASGSVTTAERLVCDGSVNLILEDGCNLTVNGGIQVELPNALTIYAQSTEESTMGKLTTQNVYICNAAIGGNEDFSGGVITINGGIIEATSTHGAAIGGGYSSDRGGSGGEITINGGSVRAESQLGAAIGGGYGTCGGGSGGKITINGGSVRAESQLGAAIGGGHGGGGSGGTITIHGGVVWAKSGFGAAIGGIGGGSGTFSTGTNGNPVIFASSIADQSGKGSWGGVIFEGGAGKVYGSPTLSLGLPIPENQSLTLDMNSNSLTFAQGTGITLNSGSTLKLSGPGSFPGGISVTGGTLAGLPAEGWAFTQNGKFVPVSAETSLSGATSLSRITVTITTQPESVSITYGETASLSVTATPTTSGSTVRYQWYLDGSLLAGETGSTLSLSTLDAGSYQVSCAVTCDGFTVDSATAAVTVGKAAGSVTITGDPSKTYDGTPALLNQDMYSTTGGTARVEYKLRDAADSTYTMSVPKKVGNYTVRVTAEDANHNPASETRDFTITPKEVTLTVTIKDKTYDKTTTAEIDTVNTNDFVSGDDVRVVNGTPTFAQSTPGGAIPVSFTEFSLTGADAGNYRLTQPTGVTGKILPTVNYLDLTNNSDFAGHTEVWIDGVKYPIGTDAGRYVNLPDTGDLLTIYTYQSGSSALSHDSYPTGMAVYRIDRQASGATVARIDALNDLLEYFGCSIRFTGKRGIRMITSLTKGDKSALTGSGLAGYTLVEYGTVVQWADTLGAKSLTLGTGKHNYAYKKGVADPVFNTTGDLTQYTNVLVWDSLTEEQLGKDIVMRPYIILSKDGETVTLYGGCVSRSIGYIAYQNRATFNPGTAAYKYVWDIIHTVYGDQYDSEYKG